MQYIRMNIFSITQKAGYFPNTSWFTSHQEQVFFSLNLTAQENVQPGTIFFCIQVYGPGLNLISKMAGANIGYVSFEATPIT